MSDRVLHEACALGVICHRGYFIICPTCLSEFTVIGNETKTATRHSLLRQGWKERTIDGRPTLFCPSCGLPAVGTKVKL